MNALHLVITLHRSGAWLGSGNVLLWGGGGLKGGRLPYSKFPYGRGASHLGASYFKTACYMCGMRMWIRNLQKPLLQKFRPLKVNTTETNAILLAETMNRIPHQDPAIQFHIHI